jgi:hypothetical protein
MCPEQIEGYLRRQGMRYRVDVDQCDCVSFVLQFSTRAYRDPNHGRNLLEVSVGLSSDNRKLKVVAESVYSISHAKDLGALCECLLWINHCMAFARFSLDRASGTFKCIADVPVKGSNLSLQAFTNILLSVPMMIDMNHRQIEAVIRTGVLQAPLTRVEYIRRLIVDVLASLETAEDVADFHDTWRTEVDEMIDGENKRLESLLEDTSCEDTQQEGEGDGDGP